MGLTEPPGGRGSLRHSVPQSTEVQLHYVLVPRIFWGPTTLLRGPPPPEQIFPEWDPPRKMLRASLLLPLPLPVNGTLGYSKIGRARLPWWGNHNAHPVDALRNPNCVDKQIFLKIMRIVFEKFYIR